MVDRKNIRIFMKKLRLIFIGCICCLYAYSKESSGGLLFTSSAEKVDKRTSLIIFGDTFREFEDSFQLSFDLSIWDIEQFGYVFRVINNQKQEVDFVFVNFYGVDKMYLDFHSPITHRSVQIPISEDVIRTKENLHLDIDFNLKEDKAAITLKDSVYTCTPIGLTNPASLQFAFGLYGLNLDVPQMLIQNISIQTADKKQIYFPLKESEGEWAYDETGKIKAHVKNPEWIVNRHFYWQAGDLFEIKGKAYIYYDEANNRMLILNRDSIHHYSFSYDKIDHVHASDIPNIPNPDYEVLHYNRFFSTTGELYQFGGYSNHAYSNKITKYNWEEKQWEAFEVSGDEISPRFYSSVGDGVVPNEKLIFGGFGNKTGKQEHGGNNLYDLYVVNLEQHSITKLWDFQNHSEDVFIPCNNLILNKEKTHFYTLCYPHHIPNTKMYLYCFDLQDGSYNIVSDSIPLISEEMNTSVNLFYSKILNEFYAVVREFTDNNTTNIRIYTLLSPPVVKTQANSSPKTDRWFVFVIVFFFFVALSIFFIIRKIVSEKKDKDLPLQKEMDGNNNRRTKSAIYVFGNFTVFDNKGKDITYRFTTKLRSVLSLILIHSNNNSKISSEKLTLYLWPDKDANEAKSIRGVTINRLRNILSDIDGITLIHKNSHWFFVFDTSFYCDYLECHSLISQLESQQDKNTYEVLMDRLALIISYGALFSHQQEAWFDSVKSKDEEKLELLLRDYIFYLYENEQYNKLITATSAFFNIEPVNNEILDLCMKSYQKLGKKEQAQAFFTRYKESYKILMGEEFLSDAIKT